MENGGAAFPGAKYWDERHGEWVDAGSDGMTLRDYFAAKAMHALMRNVGGAAEYASDIAHYAYRMADAMIEKRANQK